MDLEVKLMRCTIGDLKVKVMRFTTGDVINPICQLLTSVYFLYFVLLFLTNKLPEMESLFLEFCLSYKKEAGEPMNSVIVV